MIRIQSQKTSDEGIIKRII